MDQDEMSNLYRGPSIDASSHVSVLLAEVFQGRRLKCEKLTDDRRRTPSDGKSSHCLLQGELKMKSIKGKIIHFIIEYTCINLSRINLDLYMFMNWSALIK